jgi:hypothetical protein
MTTQNLTAPLSGATPVIVANTPGPAPWTSPSTWAAFVSGQAYQAGAPADGCIGPDGNGYVRIASGADPFWVPANWMLVTVGGQLARATAAATAAQASAAAITAAAAAAELAAAQAAGAAAGAKQVYWNLATFLAAGPVPAGVQYIQVLAVAGTPYLLGQYAYGTRDLTYKNEGAVATGVVGEVLQNGVYWRPLYDIGDGSLDMAQFGMIGDAAFNWGADTATGADNTAAAQAAIDFAQQNALSVVRPPRGQFLFAGALYLGYGQAYCSLHLIGQPTNSGSGIGTVFYPQAVDRPAISISGGTASLVRGISFIGRNLAYVAGVLGGSAIPSSPTAYLNPAITPTAGNPGGLVPTAPYCFICVDPEAGAVPAVPYPPMPTPAWTGLPSTPYGKTPSTETWIDGCSFQGAAIPIASSPNSSNNGDFLAVTNNDIKYFVYGIAVGATQARNTLIRDNRFAYGHTCITGSVLGGEAGQGGRFDGPISNNNATTCFQLVYFNGMGTTGNLDISNWYTENVVRGGVLIGGSSFSPSVAFKACSFGFSESIHGTIPLQYFVTDGNVAITFPGTTIYGASRLTALCGPGAGPIAVEGGNWQCGNGPPGGGAVTQAFANAANYCGGLLLGGGPGSYIRRQLARYYASTSSQGEQLLDVTLAFQGLRSPLTQAATCFYDNVNERRFDLTQSWSETWDFTAAFNFPEGAPTLAADVASGVFGPGNLVYDPQLVPRVGDILVDNTTQTIFTFQTVATTPDGSGNYPYTLRQENGLQVNPATGAFVSYLNSGFAFGTCTLIHANLQAPQTVFWGDFTAGSAAVANVHRGDDYADNIGSFLVVGDPIIATYVDDAGAPWPYPQGAAISAITVGNPAAVTLSHPALNTGRFPFWPVQIH